MAIDSAVQESRSRRDLSAEPADGAQLPSPAPSRAWRRSAIIATLFHQSFRVSQTGRSAPNPSLTAPHSFGDLVWESHTIDWESPKHDYCARFGGEHVYAGTTTYTLKTHCFIYFILPPE